MCFVITHRESVVNRFLIAFISLSRMRILAQNPLKMDQLLFTYCKNKIMKLQHVMAALNFIFYQDFISLLLFPRFLYRYIFFFTSCVCKCIESFLLIFYMMSVSTYTLAIKNMLFCRLFKSICFYFL